MERWWNRQDYFGWFQVADRAIPHWHRNPFTGAEAPEPTRPWCQIPDFDARVGDIKIIWEASRFDWVLTFAQHARAMASFSLAANARRRACCWPGRVTRWWASWPGP
jgi:hypothetical protein